MPTLKIKALMYPHHSMQQSFQQYSWHQPAFIKIRLAPAVAGPDIYLETDAQGVASRNVAAGTYHVSLPALPDFVYKTSLPISQANAIQPRQVTVHTGGTDKELHIYPIGDGWLVPLQLMTAATGGNKSAAVPNTKVSVVDNAGNTASFTSLADGSVYAVGPAGDVQVQPGQFGNMAPAQSDFVVRSNQVHAPIAVEYRLGRARIQVRPELQSGGQKNAIPGITFELSRDGQEAPLRQVNQGSQYCVFSDLEPGWVTVRIVAPTSYKGSPITLVKNTKEVSVSLTADDSIDLSPYFLFKYRTGEIHGRVVDSDRNGLKDIKVVASSDGLVTEADSDANGKYTLAGLKVGTWTIMLSQSAVNIKGQTLIAKPPKQVIEVQADKSKKAKRFTLESDEHGIRGNVRDSMGNPVPYATVEIRDQQMNVIDTIVANDQGAYSWSSPSSGMFVVNLLTQDGRTVQRQTITVNSWAELDLIAIDFPDGAGPHRPGMTAPTGGAAGTSPSSGPPVREAVTDLAAYPVLTEEVSTIGPPAPAGGGVGAGGPGAGYGQTVDQVMRDVLGWRPSGDVAGFQTALTGAFQLREVEGHTEWTWQQRGYAVQADMGALTGAQASIYARAQAALGQMQPLLASITALNPTLFPPEDLEAIRTIIAAELQELVNELALEGGPRIQRVDQLFTLLLGESRKSFDPNPDHVQGQLGTMRARFGLTEEWVDTVDEERILTNFRVVVEQVMSLQESWFYDRKLLAVVDTQSSLGTILIWLSRGLEAVCESVDDLTFSLDSVYVDAAQRQVIELKFPMQDPILLSDLLDWVVRAARDEGPRLIQDAGRDGVDAFAPVLEQLRTLIQEARKLIRTAGGTTLPDGMRTPRVQRAFQVLEAQIIEATRLAGLVQRQPYAQAPQITSAMATPPLDGQITVTMTGTNFRRHASAVLIPANREDLPELPGRQTTVQNPSSASASFRNPSRVPNSAGVTWQVMLTNEDGTQSNTAAI
jgi:hypothetical protein